MVKPVKTVDGRTCTVCGKGATGPWEQYMEPRCDEHKMGTDTGRRMFWRLGEDERARRGLGKPVPNARQAKTLASEDAKLAGTGVSRGDWVRHDPLTNMYVTVDGTRVPANIVDNAQSLAAVLHIAGIREAQRKLVPGMTAAEVNALPLKAREYIHQLVANADPAGMVRENMQLLDTNKGLQAMYRSAADDRDRMREVLDRVKTGMEWTREELPACWNSVDDEMLADIDSVLAGGEPAALQKHIGYMVCSDGRYMYWPVEGLQEARTYCEDNVEPVKLMADVAELNKHEDEQA